jgi:hypothetical protein
MDGKPKISARETYVLDEAEIEQLDQLSLTSVVTALVEAVPEDDPEPKSLGIAPSSVKGDTTINEILEAPSVDDQPVERSDSSAQPEPAGDLIAPELVFPDRILDR